MNGGKEKIIKLLGLQLAGYSSWEIRCANEHGEDLTIREKEMEKAYKILKRQEEEGVITIPYYWKKDYPKCFSLNLGRTAPVLIHLLGDKNLILDKEKCIAIVGARHADAEELDAAYRLSATLPSEKYYIVSGLALGCDTLAHRACLDAGGKTIAIVASGLDITHPKVNKALQDEILAKGGTILSEYPFGVKANPTRLVARCRLQAALSQTVIVAQCPIISGTMYAVRFAQEYKRNIFAVEYDNYHEQNSGNQFLLDHYIARPIRP